jgi:hypothetical protein
LNISIQIGSLKAKESNDSTMQAGTSMAQKAKNTATTTTQTTPINNPHKQKTIQKTTYKTNPTR